MPVRRAPLLLLLLLALQRPALAASALVPVPFSSAGFTLPPGDFTSSLVPLSEQGPIPLGTPVTVVVELVLCVKSGGGPLPIPPGLLCSDPQIETIPLPNGVIQLSTALYQFSATLVATPGDRWTVALQNPVLVLPTAATVGDTFAAARVTSFRIAIDAFPSATFSVPDASDAPVESVAWKRVPPNVDATAGLPLLEARSAELETATRPFSPGLLETFLDGDVVTLVGRASYELSFRANLFAGLVSSVQFEHRDPCGSATSPTGLPPRSCQVGFELHAVHPATSTASLACRADLDGSGVVNFLDLTQFKSVFFQRCEP